MASLRRRLLRARAWTDRIVTDARTDREELERELAERRAVIADAAEAARREATTLTRSLRPRHRLACETAPRNDPPANLVTYVEPPAPRLGPSLATPELRWHLLRGILSALVVAALLVALPAHASPPTLDTEALRAALLLGHRDVFGRAPSPERLRVALAQSMLETGRGRKTCGHNVGGIHARRGEPACRYGRATLRRYTSARASARAYWRLRAVRAALPWFDRGDAEGAGRALGRARYYTADADDYAEAMRLLYAELYAENSR